MQFWILILVATLARSQIHKDFSAIVGGEIAPEDKFLFQVAFLKRGLNVQFCSGSLIHPQWVGLIFLAM